MRWLVVGSMLLIACRPKEAPRTMPASDAEAAAGVGDAAIGPPPAVVVGAVSEVLFSPKGRLAFLTSEDKTFAVIDLESGAVAHFRGQIERPSMLGFDNRCDVTERGMTPNVDIWYAATDASERIFLRTADSVPYRENLDRHTSLAFKDKATLNANVVSTMTQFVKHDSNVLAPLPFKNGEVVVSRDTPARAVLVGTDEANENLWIDELGGKHWALPIVSEKKEPPHRPWVSFDRQLVIADHAMEKNFRGQHCFYDLPPGAGPGRCVEYGTRGNEHILVSDDGKRIAYGEQIAVKTTVSPTDDTARDTSADLCFMHVFDRTTGKDVKWKIACGITGELPLRFEGDVLVSDGASIHECGVAIIKKVDVTKGTPKGTERKTLEEDVDDGVLAAMKKMEPGLMPFLQKQKAWAETYKLELLAWSEGESVLARRGDDLVLCKKRRGTCGAALASLAGAGTLIGGASKDGARLGVAVDNRYIAVDAATGKTFTDIAFRPGGSKK